MAPALTDLIRHSADPSRVEGVLARLGDARPGAVERIEADDDLAATVVAAAAASGWLGRLLVADPQALDVLDRLEASVAFDPVDARALARWRHLEHLRLAGRDLTGRAALEETMRGVTAMAATVLDRALDLAEATDLAVIGMGKVGGIELNYASDVDILLVGPTGGPPEQAAARRFLGLARPALRVDVDLRPEGRDGALVRTLEGYRSHWDRWAEPWERQALLKARPLAGDGELGVAFAAAADGELWDRGLGTEAIHQIRTMKGRTERQAAASASGPRNIKHTPGGLRDIEFSIQLLQLVHGPHDPSLRHTGTLPALAALADGGYVAEGDAVGLDEAYRLLRRVEHAAQLDEDRQTHELPEDRAERGRLARSLGWTGSPRRAAVDRFDDEVRRCRTRVRGIHERVYFRPLLDAFAGIEGSLGPDAAAARLAAFGFVDAERTRQAVSELTRGLTRASRLMAQMLPLLLDWLSVGPDPEQGLLALRTLVAADADTVVAACRDSPETARRLCLVAATSASLTRSLGGAPDVLASLASLDGPLRSPAEGTRSGVGPGGRPADDAALAPTVGSGPHRELRAGLVRAVTSRPDVDAGRWALVHLVRRERSRIAAADVLGDLDHEAVGPALAAVAHGAVEAAVALADPQVPFAVLALGRLAGGRLGYGSDLDLLLVHDATDEAGREEAARAGEVVRRVLLGTGPSDRTFAVDLDLRPGGRAGPLVQGLRAVGEHLDRWAEPWMRLAYTRLEPLAGDPGLGVAVIDAVASRVWAPLDDGDRRAIRRVKARAERERIPAGEDPAFHLKLGPGALADVELTVALLLLEHGIREPSTTAGIGVLRDAGHLDEQQAVDLAAAHGFCDRARDRWTLITGRAQQSLPAGDELAVLARSLGTTAPLLRDRYLRLTRRSRRVVEARFYGQEP